VLSAERGRRLVLLPRLLRPDVLDLSRQTLFYVEAKQYADAYVRNQIRAAYRQVWGTWGRLRKSL
jgi:hypothetical protein